MEKEIIDYINSKKPAAVSQEELKQKFNIQTVDEIKDFSILINYLLQNGQLMKNNKQNLLTPYSVGYYLGILRGNAKGFAFLLNESGDDIFVPSRLLNGAFDGDTVYVKPLAISRGSSLEGEVVKVVKRGRSELVGTYIKNGRFGFVLPDDKRFFNDIFIDNKDSLRANNGDKVVVTISKYPSGKRKNPEGKISEIIGKNTDPMIDVLSILRANGIKDEFESETIKEAECVPQTVLEKDKKSRTDFSNNVIITIDGEDAKDLDDAVEITKLPGDKYRLGVHIADVSHYVKNGSMLDKEALSRGTSVYFPGMVIPMLPRQLSNNICSLNENVDRLTLSVIMDIDKNGKVINHEIVEGIIKTTHRMTYTSVTKVLNGDKAETEKYSDVKDMIFLMSELAQILTKLKKQRGSIDFDTKECKIEVDSFGKVLSVKPYERTISHRIIEEFMILANETVAKHMYHLQLPFIYRIHETPSLEKIENFKSFLAGIGKSLNTKGELHSRQLLDILESVKDTTIYPVINRVMLKSMQKAKYSPDNIGHFGLASKYYCHFTSPIRRYPDLMIHRIIKLMINGRLDENLIIKLNSRIYDIAFKNSESEKKADETEREIDDLKKTEYMVDKIGQKYDGVISGVTNFGIFIELDNTVEGIVKIENLPKDAYNYIENAYMYKGKNHSYRLGDTVKIVVESVNIDSKRVEFLLYDENNSIK